MASTEEINESVLSSDFPSSADGVSNVERAAFVCEVFNAERIDLNQKIPYEAILKSKDPMKVLAAIHLAQLQYQYTNVCRYEGLIEDERAVLYSSFLQLMIAKLAHRKKYLDAGVTTVPPYAFIN